MDAAPPRRQWWQSFWFAIVAILLAVGCLTLAVGLLLWAIIPAIVAD
jgi:hypothetical protein